MNLRCMIVDDEPGAVNLLVALIRQATTWQLVATCYNGLEAIAFLKNNEVDLVFMDINMPLVNGLELASSLSPANAIVFTTAYSEYAVESYVYHTIDYLLKPITLNRFVSSVRKIEEHFKTLRTVQKGEIEAKDNEYFFVKSGKEHRRILLNEILFFESRKEYVRVVTTSSDILTYRRLKDVEVQLPAFFTRIHQSFIVNMQQVTKIQDNHVFVGEKRLPIGEKYRNSLMEVVRKKTF